MKKQLGIVIVNYKTPDLVIDCLRSLVPVVAEDDCRVAVVDNASGDGSVERIGATIEKAGWGSWAVLQPSEKNLGFAGGNNLAIRPMLAQANPPAYILLLNSDTVVRPGAVRALLDFMEAHPAVGIAGSRLEDPDETVQNSTFRFHTLWSELDGALRLGIVTRLLDRWKVASPMRSEAHETDWVAGASMIIRKEVFDAIGLLDEDYFMYFEETDFCLRARRAGWSCWYVPASRVVHLVGKASGVTERNVRPRRLPRYWFESRYRYFRKNFGWFYTLATNLGYLVGYAMWRLRRIVQRKPDTDPPRKLWDFFRYNFLPF